jgi:hypothetical protein
MHAFTASAAAALVLLATVAAAGDTQAPPAAPKTAAATAADRKVPFRPGETLTYDVSWSTYLTAGVATMTVRDRRASGASTAYYIVAEARTAGLLSKLYTVYYKADTLLDTVSLLPQRGSLYSEEGDRHRTRITRFDQSAQRADFEVRMKTLARASLRVPKYSQDALSAIYVLRAIPLKPGTRLTMPVCDGGAVYRVEFSVATAETVALPTGRVQAYRLRPTIVDMTGQLVGRPMTIWLSADDRRLPVKLRAELAIGSVDLLLRQVTP